MSIPLFTEKIPYANGLSIQLSLGNEATRQLKTWRSDPRCTSKRLPQIVSVTLYACVREREPQCSFVNGMNGHEGAGEPREFVTTRWSLILSAAHFGSEEQKARDALAELCRTYWRPIFSFVRGRGYSIEDAQDLTQDFFVTILKNDWLQHADRNRGRFRSLLLRSLQNFLINAAEKTHARKRGGGVEFVSWDDWMAEAPSAIIHSGCKRSSRYRRSASSTSLGRPP